MAIKTIYIARHGYRSNWLPKGPYPPPPTGVDSDVPLAEHGINQAKELAHYILSIDNQPEMIFSSPFYRCIQTTDPIASYLEQPIYLDRGIGEWYKPDRPVIPEPAPFEVLDSLFPNKISPDWKDTIVPSNKGEDEDQIFVRCKKFWPMFIQNIETEFPNIETILIVTHAATKIALGMSLLRLQSCRESIDEDGTIIRSGSCSLDKYELLQAKNNEDEDEDPESIPFDQRVWSMTMNGNTEFLTNGEEMNWNFQNKFEAGSDADIRARKLAAEQAGKNLSSGLIEAENEENETIYVSVDIPSHNYREKTEIIRSENLQFSGLETEQPLFKIGDKIYQGDWRKLVGTELAFPNASLTKKNIDEENISLSPINQVKHDKTKKNSNREEEEEDNDEEQETDETDGEEEDDDEEEEVKQEAPSEKIYRITDRIILNEVKPM
ncbi:hypothetical protein Kpol_505p12 [Vanderwaltozyma polyspora DSM 70294]|uniref:Transcription factor TFIIIC triple barrel domain-containing protein n=1 Tax=Vanderwaltozyma polyspora (strain ATCC 22028 / DSM 70294 / BCRC 21397 / CBS 2163 / NBRC 10782 / NRRL Y-8283 / UCD 57-17) TaxID=436907 RepID=A7TNA3_VANPO|nr:uncharacterized protein Kpol_505p12 [Vanderwaltozyma polyspora DSM 70294]EDO16235.1 hypothetical protein Kpol_505p12 [Vanderwaltozyma polyspora DSM 70294]